MSWIDLFQKGGFLMWPLLGFGAVGLGIFLERLLYFGATFYPIERYELELESDLHVDSWNGSRDMSDDSAQPPARDGDEARGVRGLDRWLPARDVRRGASAWHRIARAFYANRNAPAAARDAHLTRLGEELIHAMQRRIGVLSLIAGTAPLVGLLGTVGGMMLSFQEIAATGGQADIGRLADGLWVAMITTFAGLSVAIPSYLAHGFLQGLVERRVSAMNNLLRLLEERHAHLREAVSGVSR